MKSACLYPKFKTPVGPWERSCGYGPQDRMRPLYRMWRGSTIASIRAPKNIPSKFGGPFFCSADNHTEWCETEEECIKFVEEHLILEGYPVKGLLWAEE